MIHYLNEDDLLPDEIKLFNMEYDFDFENGKCEKFLLDDGLPKGVL